MLALLKYQKFKFTFLLQFNTSIFEKTLHLAHCGIICSVTDILNARELDPDEILTSLGFANCHDEMNKRDVSIAFVSVTT